MKHNIFTTNENTDINVISVLYQKISVFFKEDWCFFQFYVITICLFDAVKKKL